ncbi:alpha/beta fold hydrolase [Magnetococcales bacterium HHB-1]
MKKPIIVFAHGWGFGRGVWWPLIKKLPDYPTVRLDFGFFGDARCIRCFPEDQPWVAVGHSLGVLWLLHQFNDKKNRKAWSLCQGFLSINGFSRYAQNRTFFEGIPVRVLERMIAVLHRNPIAVLQDFQLRSGLMTSLKLKNKDKIHVPRLVEGLNWLKKYDERSTWRNLPFPRQALSCRNDLIAPEALTKASFKKEEILWSKQGGHLLPLSAPKTTAKVLKRFIKSL